MLSTSGYKRGTSFGRCSFRCGLRQTDPVQTAAVPALTPGESQSGICLSGFRFGRNCMDDAVLQAPAQNGNGQAAFIGTPLEAQKVLVDQLTGPLCPR